MHDVYPLAAARRAGALREKARRVLVVCPGGLEHGGGIGRQMGYFLGAARHCAGFPCYELLDSRGPWFLGEARWRSVMSLAYLIAGMARLIAARAAGGKVMAHVNVTGRGSTVRKVMLLAAARAVGLRYVLHVHDYDYAADYLRRSLYARALVRRMFGAAERVIVLGQAEREKLAACLEIPLGSFVVMPNAVPAPVAAAPPQGGETRLLFLGHLSQRKGVPELLRALANPLVKALPWRATLAGGGDIETYRSLAFALGIADRVDFTGWLRRDEAEAALTGAEVLVLPSHAEGLAMAVLEGLSHGLAVIATPVGAHAEVIEDGVSGVLVPPGDAVALAEALRLVIEAPAWRAALQDGARRRFAAAYEISGYAARLAALHEAVLDGCLGGRHG